MAAPIDEKRTCEKCGRTMRSVEFFSYKDGTRCEICKDCLCTYIDNTNPDTFMWILEKFDVPYLERRWVEIYNKLYRKDPSKMGPRSVIGWYLRDMKMQQYSSYGFADSDMLNFKDKQRLEQYAITEERKAELDEKLREGHLTEQEYNTLMMTSAEIMKAPELATNYSQESERAITEQLTDEDCQYLLLKWGELYRPPQWVRLEELYQRYAAEYELNADREDALKKICKTSLKIDEALDIGDVAAVDKLQRTYDNLRKSARFTDAQNKEVQEREMDSIGELVAFVEREGGAIPLYDDPIEYPQDKIDFIIKDMQNYINNLVRDELGLGNIIEAYIQKLDQNKTSTVEEIMQEGFGNSKDDDDDITEEDVEAFSDFQADEIEQEATSLLEEFGG